MVSEIYNSNIVCNGKLCDLLTDIWRPTRNMIYPRDQHTASLLSNGRVLVVGGIGQSTAESYHL